MSQDIRSFFLNSKQNKKKTNLIENKSREKINNIVISDEEMHTSLLDQKAINIKKKKVHENKSHIKKRTVISSDEDEVEVTSYIKNKKAKFEDNKSSDHLENLMEIIDKSELFNEKPVKRVNAIKIRNGNNKKQIELSPLNHKVDFMSKDDDFDATLNQLDTSQIEDKYLSTINNETFSLFKYKVKDPDKLQNIEELKVKCKSNSNDKEKEEFDSPEKKEVSVEKNSSMKINTIKDHNFIKREKLKKNKIKNLSNVKLKVDKECTSHSNNSPVINYNEVIKKNIEKKKYNAILYQNYLNRGGARNPGSKKIPEGSDLCLINLNFLITGVLDSLEREEAEEIIKQYGGKIVHSVTKKLNYIIIGDEPGPSKLAKAERIGVKIITEDGFLDLLRTRPPGIEIKKCSTIYINKDKNKGEDDDLSDDNKSHEETENNKNIKKRKINVEHLKNDEMFENSKEIVKSNNLFAKLKSNINTINTDTLKIKRENSLISSKIIECTKTKIENKECMLNSSSNNELINKTDHDFNYITALVEKYRPKELKQIIGQIGEKSNAKKLQYWLSNWYKNHNKKSKYPKSKFSSRNDTGTIFKAALLSGPPGIGKTTTAYVVCDQLGYEILEFNASDTRSKKLLQEEISGIIFNRSIKTFLTNTLNKKETLSKHVLLMDEVDGMAGNEDRGGIQELIAFIKSTEIPIICICNDRNSQKIKTLANYTFDLRFQKPRLEQIRAAMMSLCFKEGIKITPEELTLIIQSTNQDIRQVINHIAILSAKSKIITENKEKIKYKNLKLGPWDVVRKVFNSSEHKSMNIHDKSDLFFHDYNIASLFVEENYPIVIPNGLKSELHKKLANCSESLAIGDIIENTIRVNQSWNLLPVQACFSSVIPGSEMSGILNSQINFPSWLGRNSKKIKLDRLLQNITVHTRITTGANKEAINLDYLKLLLDSIIKPMIIEGTKGIEKAVNVMNTYHLSREDLDSLLELTKWPHTRDPMQSINTKTKIAFTKAYNKSISFSNAGTIKKKCLQDNQNEDFIISDEEELLNNNRE